MSALLCRLSASPDVGKELDWRRTHPSLQLRRLAREASPPPARDKTGWRGDRSVDHSQLRRCTRNPGANTDSGPEIPIFVGLIMVLSLRVDGIGRALSKSAELDGEMWPLIWRGAHSGGARLNTIRGAADSIGMDAKRSGQS